MKAKQAKHVRRENKKPFWELCLDMAADQESPSCIKIYSVDRGLQDDVKLKRKFDKAMEVIAEIDDRCLIDFESSLEWAQWCREVASACILGDWIQVDRLISSQREDRDHYRSYYKEQD